MVVKLLASALLSTLVLGAHAAPAARPAGSGEAPLALSLVRGGELATDPVVNGTLSYVATGRVVATWDFRNPNSPLRVATSAPAEGVINSMARHGDYLYASWKAMGVSSGVVVYSLADPRQPELVWAGDYPVGGLTHPAGLAVANDHLYLFDSENGVYVADLDSGNPAQPEFTLVPEAGLPVQYTRVAAFGNLIYGTGRNFIGATVFDTYDVSTPRAPVMLSSLGLDGLNNFSITPDNGRAVSVGWQFNTWDLSVPGELTQRSSTEIYGALSAAIVGNRAYTFGFDQLQAWDIRNLSAARLIGSNRTHTIGARNAAAMGHTLLVPTATDLLHAYNVRPAIPGRLSTSWLPAGVDPRRVEMHDGRLVLLQGNYGLTINDAQTLAPQARFEAKLPPQLQARAFEDMAVKDGIAYLASWGYGLIMVDLAAPTPREIGRMPFSRASVVAVEGDHAYLAKNTDGPLFVVADVSDPTAPSAVWEAPLPGMPHKLQVAGGHVYLAESWEGGESGGLHVFNLDNPAAPAHVAYLDDRCGSAFDLSVDEANARLYLACEEGMQVVDISTPAQPQVIGYFDTGIWSPFSRVTFRGDRAWFTNDNGLHELDISNPAQPAEVQRTHIGRQWAYELQPLDDGRLVVVAANAGVHLFAPEQDAGVRKPRVVAPGSRAAKR